jgi:hypothetical protein
VLINPIRLFTRSRWNSIVDRGKGRSLAIWNAGWFCRVRKSIFFTTAATPPGATPFTSISLQRFKSMM